MKLDVGSLEAKVAIYKGILKNTDDYRSKWGTEVKPMLIKTLEYINKKIKLGAIVEVKENLENLEVIILNLGKKESRIKEIVPDSDLRRPLIKSFGALAFQQLFNGKIMIMVVSPYIEGYGDPKPPRTLEIVRPHELTEGYILRYMDEFLKDLTDWEDFDDDAPSHAAIGFGTQQMILQDDNPQ